MDRFSLPAYITALLIAYPLYPSRAEDPKPMGPVNLSCNTAADDTDPHISSDGRLLFFAGNPKGQFDIFVSVRPTINNAWRKAEVVEDDVSTKVDDSSVFVTSEGQFPQYMYFATKTDAKVNNYDLYVAVRQGPRAAFSARTPLNSVCTAEDEAHPWLSPDGRQLYFSRKTKDGWRVLVTSRQATTGAAGFGDPVLLKELPAGFHHATLTPDGKQMYLQGPLEKDRWGLFVSTNASGKWSEPKELNINSAHATTGDVAPCLSRDGRLLYFASDRPGGKGKLDVWVIPTAQLKTK